MVDCPRCGSSVDRLVSLPAAAIERPVVAGRPETDDDFGRVCQWCRHEVLEG